jgi:hypothetical protein
VDELLQGHKGRGDDAPASSITDNDAQPSSSTLEHVGKPFDGAKGRKSKELRQNGCVR